MNQITHGPLTNKERGDRDSSDNSTESHGPNSVKKICHGPITNKESGD